MRRSLGRPALSCLSRAAAFALITMPGCGGLTTASPGDGGADARMMTLPDATTLADSGMDTGRDAGTTLDASLAPACLAVSLCCPQIPQVQLPDCMSTVSMNSAQFCQFTLDDYAGEIPDAGCDGSPTGTPACETLAFCCFADPSMQHCHELVDAGNGPACTTEYLSLWNGMECVNGPGP